MEDWLEILRQRVETHFGDRVESVNTTTRDHYFAFGIVIRLRNGWRHAVVIGESDKTGDDVIAHLEKWLEVKQANS